MFESGKDAAEAWAHLISANAAGGLFAWWNVCSLLRTWW